MGSYSYALAPSSKQTSPDDTHTIIINYTPGDGMTNPGFVFGGYAANGYITGNTVKLINGMIGEIFGGFSANSSGIVTDNIVKIIGGMVTSSIHGGYSYSGTGAVTGNTVKIIGGTVYSSVYGGRSNTGEAAGNIVKIIDGTRYGYVYGGSSISGAVTGNTVEIIGGTAIGNSPVYGGYSTSGTVTGNTVKITGGTANGSVSGGSSSSGTVTGNTVKITGGTANGPVYGGFSSSGAATDNIITIGGSPTFSSSGTGLYGGYGSGTDKFTGNTLNILNAIASETGTVASVQNFENLNFILPADIAKGATPQLTAAQAVILGNGSGTRSTVDIEWAGAPTNLNDGDTITLIHSNTDQISGDLATTSSSTTTGTKSTTVDHGLRISTDTDTHAYTFDISHDTTDLIATLKDKVIATTNTSILKPQTKALSEAQVAGQDFLNRGQDLAGTQGVRLLRENVRAGAKAFLASSYNDYHYEAGSHVNVRGTHLLTGPAWGKRQENADLALGAFIEAGEGNYNSSNTFDALPAVRGHGRTRYYGLGLLGSLEQDSGIFVDGSLRIGRIDTDFKSRGLTDPTGASAKYDSGSLYYGAQASLGYAFKPNDKTRLEAYTRLSWTRQESDSVKIFGDKVHFSAINSQRLRGGLRHVYSASESFTPYIGVAYEHEFDSQSKAKILEYKIDTLNLKGGTTIAELGFTYRATKTSPFSASFDLQSYAGKRKGSGGSFRLDYRF